ncbi:alpha-amylase family glycosyl hydrolase [Paenibacillus durus]|uniref:alpha-amylase family glycosyl hydrolase n=1 Tax=Paenibacillus durus TaxID=44251 RepID=UPI0009E06CA6|nr:alpha-amylase family glycosyl hydrolase [Paenibacillus durus]
MAVNSRTAYTVNLRSLWVSSNRENPHLRDEVYEMMLWWLDKGVDGFRMDVINFLSKVPELPDGEVVEGYSYGNGFPYFMNGPQIHTYLREMHDHVLSKHEVVTVGETLGATVDEAKLYTGKERHELDMVFQFDHVTLGYGKYGRWSVEDWKLTELKEIFSRWQYGLEEDGWNSLYWNNHDQPRAVSTFGNDNEEYRVVSAKMLGVCLHLQKGSPFIYQGEELGMTNVQFPEIGSYKDIETMNGYRDYCSSGLIPHDEMMKAIHKRSRDNARTPMQWNSSLHGGFTTGEPWIKLNPNYPVINAEQSLADPDSVFYFYKKLIKLRKENEIVVYGKFDEILEENEEIFAYTRTLKEKVWLVVCNFTAGTPVFILPERYAAYSLEEWVLGNYQEDLNRSIHEFELKPYEAAVISLKAR